MKSNRFFSITIPVVKVVYECNICGEPFSTEREAIQHREQEHRYHGGHQRDSQDVVREAEEAS